MRVSRKAKEMLIAMLLIIILLLMLMIFILEVHLFKI